MGVKESYQYLKSVDLFQQNDQRDYYVSNITICQVSYFKCKFFIFLFSVNVFFLYFCVYIFIRLIFGYEIVGLKGMFQFYLIRFVILF